LRIASGQNQSRIRLLVEFLEELENLLMRFEKYGPSSIIETWTRDSSFANGRRLEINDGFRVIEGTTRGLNPFGALRLETWHGKIEEVYSGDVVSWN
jgi:biotin-(acetyl-CoA carboxylase) ligase